MAQPDSPPASHPLPPGLANNLKMLAPDTIAAMESVAERFDVKPGEIIFTEDEQANDLFIIESGEVVAYRAGKEDDEEWPVQRLGVGDVLGEASFMDGGKRHLTARAETDSVLLKVNPFDLLTLENGDHYYDNLRASVGIMVVHRLRVGTDIQVATLEHQLEMSRTQQHFGQFFIYTIIMFSIGMIVSNVIATQLLEVDIYTQQFAWQYLAVLMVPSFIIVWKMHIPLQQLGLTMRGMRKSLIEGVLASLLVLVVTVVFYIASNRLAFLPDRSVSFDASNILPYLLHSFFQEVVARGLLQNSFQRFLKDKSGFKSVLLSGTLFGMFHIHFGLLAVVLVIVSSLAFGLFYLRHQNLVGVTLLHFMVGACAFTIGLL